MALTKLLTDLIDGSLGTDWQSSVKTADFTAVVGQGYFVDTTSAAITVTLPSSPSAGNEVTIVDYAGTADTNSITITSSDNINGGADDLLINYERGGVSMVYSDTTQGWLAYNAANETATALAPDAYNIDYLLAAGGGGGGNNDGGGGGAGGLLESTITSIASGNTLTITIGSGGAGALTGNYQAYQGSDSVISSAAITDITAIGGGAGDTNNTLAADRDGGSGGGAKHSSTVVGLGTAGQGNNGGTGLGSPYYAGGGGGGAGAVGANASTTSAGAGGAGLVTTIISATNANTSSVGEVAGSSVYFAGGGGAGEEGISGNAFGAGGIGGGGDGNSTANAEDGAANTGGGGGGAGYTGAHYNAGSGGSGVCILKIPTAKYSSSSTGSPDVYTEGNYTILVFKTSGSYTT